MKKLFLGLMVFLCPFLRGQNHNTLANQMNYTFALLEKNRIPHSILIDYGYDFVDPTAYNGVLQSNNYITPLPTGNYIALWFPPVSILRSQNWKIQRI